MFARTFSLNPRRLGPSSLRFVSPLAIALAVACGGGGGDTPTNPGNPGNPGGGGPTVTTSVNLQGSLFNPADIQVSPGATVTFTNLDGIPHTVTFDNTNITSIDSYSTGAKTVTMPTATGTYPFHCQFHGNMKGTVVVK
jgi:plastocyanin